MSSREGEDRGCADMAWKMLLVLREKRVERVGLTTHFRVEKGANGIRRFSVLLGICDLDGQGL
jgi:hypothetical protein